KVSVQLSRIRDSGLRLMTTVHDLLEASTLLKEGNKLRVEESNVADIVESVCATFGEWAEQKKLSIEKQLFGCVSRTYLDPIKVELILENMLSNACRTVPRGGQLLIRITVEQQEAKIEIYTTTTGSRLESLTRRLKRVATPWESERDEMRDQLDLCIVKLAAMAHNGFAFCSYGPENKRRLAVHLPVESREHQDSQAEMTTDWVAPECDDTQKYQYHHDKPRQGSVAWITNLPDHGLHKGQQLRTLEMIVNSNLEFGIGEIARAMPDIILLFVDIITPQVMDWLITLKQEPELVQIPVIVLSDSLAAETAHELHLAGVDACIQGSIQPHQLEQRINSIVAQRERLKNIYSKRFVIKTIHSPAGDLNADEHF
ncbi:MAG: hypothetical protein HC859_13240, partial [Bacteroidia bacterium]|nr:hypothetical protein [Bacteroidia bacterium]